MNDKPVWEPPVLDYTNLMGDEYDKRREALLRHYKGDVVKTTKYLDTHKETLMLVRYRVWIGKELEGDWMAKDQPRALFFEQLLEEAGLDHENMDADRRCLRVRLSGLGDGLYHACLPWDEPQTASEASNFTTSSVSYVQKADILRIDSHTSSLSAKYAISSTTTSLLKHCILPLIQPKPEITEATALLPRNNNAQEEDLSTFLSAIMCGCPCS